MNTTPRRTLADRVSLVFLKQLVATPQGRSLLLTQLADAEAEGEGGLFERLSEVATHDPSMQRLISRHAADEEAHAARIYARIDEIGAGRPHLPPTLNVMRALDARMKVLDAPLTTPVALMRAYLLLQVLEEYVVHQFALFIETLEPVDPSSAAMLKAIRVDEERHVRYCIAISTRFAPSPELREQTLADFRAASTLAFTEVGLHSMHFIGSSPAFAHRAGWAWAWRALATVTRLVTGAADGGEFTASKTLSTAATSAAT